MFAQSQLLGSIPVGNDWMKRLWRMGARKGAQCFSIKAGTLSGPVAFVVSMQ